jgi:transposase-like protein
MATRTKTASFDICCPKCWSTDSRHLSINLNDLDDIVCGDCDSSFTAEEAVALLAEQLEKWKKVQRWVAAGRAILSEAE